MAELPGGGHQYRLHADDEADYRDAQHVTTRCAYCPEWHITGTVADNRKALARHRMTKGHQAAMPRREAPVPRPQGGQRLGIAKTARANAVEASRAARGTTTPPAAEAPPARVHTTRLVRTGRGTRVHLSTCARANGGTPWEWAEGRDDADWLTLGFYKPCLVCLPHAAQRERAAA